jgi:hypothetical protein
MPSANSNRRAPVSMACDIPVGEVRVTDDELTLMQPTSIALSVVVVNGGFSSPTDPEDAAGPESDVADVSRPLAPE